MFSLRSEMYVPLLLFMLPLLIVVLGRNRQQGRTGRTGDQNCGTPRCCEYGVDERGRGSIKGNDRTICWVRSMLLWTFQFWYLCRILFDNVLELSKMSKRATWKKILESEEDNKKIAEIFKQIDEHTKNFHVRSPTHINQPRFWCYAPSSNSC